MTPHGRAIWPAERIAYPPYPQLTISSGWLKRATLTDEGYVDVAGHQQWAAMAEHCGADLLTLWPIHLTDLRLHREFVDMAVMPVTSYDQWFTVQINNKVRNLVKKAAKSGVEVRECAFDLAFATGLSAIFNETPLRQGRPFLHYGKTPQTVLTQFSRFLFRERVFGAYREGHLIGVLFLGMAETACHIGQIISLQSARNLAVNNALIAKAVEVCAEAGKPSLVYAFWPRSTLRDFKKQNGFVPTPSLRYQIPLTWKGRLALRLKLHTPLSDRIPDGLHEWIRARRSEYHQWRTGR